MTGQRSASGSGESEPASQRVSIPDVPEPDMQSPLHPESPGPEHWAQVVATGSDQVRSYLTDQGMPAGEIARLIAEAYQAGTITFPEAQNPDRTDERLILTFVDGTWRLAIHSV
jgi:hypothetical protein